MLPSDLQQALLKSEKQSKAVALRRSKSAPGSNGNQVQRTSSITRMRNLAPAWNPTRLAGLALLVYLATGIICFLNVKDALEGTKTETFVDALYFCVVTMTTVGYGDLVPAKTAAKVMTCVLVLVGFGFVGLLLANAATYLVDKQERLLEKAIQQFGATSGRASAPSTIKRVHFKVAVAAAAVLLLFVVGSVVLVKVEGQSWLESIYCICVTVTTLGYGDFSFKTAGGRAFATVWILLSTIAGAQLVLCVAELVTEGRQQALTKYILCRRITSSDLEAADMDDDGAVSLAEFIVYKLREMGKIEDEDLTAIVRHFRELDLDMSGTITLSDLNISA